MPRHAEFETASERGQDVLHDKPIMMKRRVTKSRSEIALQYNDSYSETVSSFANNINTVDGGRISRLSHLAHPHYNAIGQSVGLFKDMKENLQRRRVVRAGGSGQRQALAAAVRGPDQGQAPTLTSRATVQAFVNERLVRVPLSRIRHRQAHHQTRPSSSARSARRPQGARPDPPQGRPGRRWACPASWPTGSERTRGIGLKTSFIWFFLSRRKPAGRQRKQGRDRSQPFWPLKAKSSTSKRPATTRCWAMGDRAMITALGCGNRQRRLSTPPRIRLGKIILNDTPT